MLKGNAVVLFGVDRGGVGRDNSPVKPLLRFPRAPDYDDPSGVRVSITM